MNQPTSSASSTGAAASRTDAAAAATQIGAVPAAGAVTLPEQFGRYRILKKLGEGGMGAVFLAEDTRLNHRRVAIKVPTLNCRPGSDEFQRFQREAGLAASLRHPNLCPVHDIGEHDGVHYISMDFIEGQPLSSFIGKKQSLRTVALLVRKIAQAMAEAHTRGIIHRDLKPENVMIDSRKEPIVMDFGLATSAAGQSTKITQSGMILGSPAYMAKEQVLGETEKFGPHTDVYALGVILYELLTGKVPFEGPTVTVVLGRILANEPTPPGKLRPELDPALEAICLKAMAKEIPHRYATMTEFAAALARYLKGNASSDGSLALGPGKAAGESLQQNSAVAAAGAPSSTESRRPPRRFFGVLATALLVGGAAAALAMLGPWRRNEDPAEDRSSLVVSSPATKPDDARSTWAPDDPGRPDEESSESDAEMSIPEMEIDSGITETNTESTPLPTRNTLEQLTKNAVWVPLVSEERVADARYWKLKDGVLSTIKPSRRAILNLNNFNRANLLVQLRVEMPKSDAELVLGVREDHDSGVRVQYQSNGEFALLRKKRGQDVVTISRWEPRKKPSGEFTLALAAVGNEVSVFVDGRLIRRFTGERLTPQAGHIMLQVVHPGVRIREVQGIDLDALKASSEGDSATTAPPAGTSRKETTAAEPIDLLRRITLPKDIVRGEWKFTGTALDTNFGTLDGQARLQIPGAVPDEYRLDLEVERLGDRYFALAVGFVMNGQQAVLEIDGYGHPVDSPGDIATAISLVDGKRGDKSETAISRGQRLLPLNERRQLSLEVRRDRVIFLHEGKERLRWTADPKRLSLSPTWNVPDKKSLLLGSQAPFRIYRYTLTPL